MKPVPKRGRPKTAEGQRSVKTTLTFHPSEINAIKVAAKTVKTKPATFIRKAALDACLVVGK